MTTEKDQQLFDKVLQTLTESPEVWRITRQYDGAYVLSFNEIFVRPRYHTYSWGDPQAHATCIWINEDIADGEDERLYVELGFFAKRKIRKAAQAIIDGRIEKAKQEAAGRLNRLSVTIAPIHDGIENA